MAYILNSLRQRRIIHLPGHMTGKCKMSSAKTELSNVVSHKTIAELRAEGYKVCGKCRERAENAAERAEKVAQSYDAMTLEQIEALA